MLRSRRTDDAADAVSSPVWASPRAIRYGGLTGSLLLALAAVLGGARTALWLGAGPSATWNLPFGPGILASWLVGLILLTVAWWQGLRGVPGLGWAASTVALWSAPLLAATPYGSRDLYSYACQGAGLAAGRDPYAEGPAAMPCPWLGSVSNIWRETPAPYGPLFVLLAGLAVTVGGVLWASVAVLKLAAVIGVVMTGVGVPMAARRRGLDPSAAFWLILACPLAPLHLIGGGHNDALMIGFAVLGIAVILAAPDGGRRRLWLLLAGGALLGAAVMVKATAGVLLPFAVLLAGRSTGLVDLVRQGWAVIVGAVVTVAGLTFLPGLGFGWVGALRHSGDSIQWTSPPTAVGQTIDYVGRLVGLPGSAVPAVRLVAMVALLAALVWIWWRAWRDGADPLLAAGLAMFAVVALSPVFHPWYLLLPLATLAVAASTARWRLFAAISAVAGFLVLPDGSGLVRYVKFPGAPLMTITVVVVAVRVWRARPGRAEARPDLSTV
ncbi:polyprenol phosphomannose-dependent alpha 1,6 mannosyltransferase MptB [Pilimelia columellifera]|uniref:Alpha-(1->6)-mannopyranosyltransferase A n=1 Tax=Pilimelia columellifera subsp. columellifera TaxID=706583 RepID=A0ABN3NQB6_9ACTN